MCCSSVCVWDIRSPKQNKVTEEKNLSGIPTTFKHIDLTWKPHLKVCFMGNRIMFIMTNSVRLVGSIQLLSATISLLGFLLSSLKAK